MYVTNVGDNVVCLASCKGYGNSKELKGGGEKYLVDWKTSCSFDPCLLTARSRENERLGNHRPDQLRQGGRFLTYELYLEPVWDDTALHSQYTRCEVLCIPLCQGLSFMIIVVVL